MAGTLDEKKFQRRLRTAARRIRAEKAMLSELDSALGDGDHGTAMERVCDALETGLDRAGETDLKRTLSDLAWDVMAAAGGSTSTLYGSFFLGMSDGISGEAPFDASALARLFAAGEAELRSNTKAEVGGKTLVDALVPAVEALRQAAADGADPGTALTRAAEAATAGAESTRELRAVHGRARNLGDRTIGHIDPGAMSMALFFQGFAQQ